MADRSIRIAHMFPEVLNLYGDRGNIICLKKRLEWRGIGCDVTEVKLGDQLSLSDFDLFFIGGGQDFEQEVLLSDLKAGKGDNIKAAIEDGKTFYRGWQDLPLHLRWLPDDGTLLRNKGRRENAVPWCS